MFPKATANFVRQIDPEGNLIHVSRLNDSRKLVPMALVVKRNRTWMWQSPKYQPTNFSLADLLLGDKELIPEVSEAEFVKYEEKLGDSLGIKVDTRPGVGGLMLEGRGTTELQSSFGKLRKQEVEVRKLLLDSSDRRVDMRHVLVQQLKRQVAAVLAVVTERILTSDYCTITQMKKEKYMCQGVLDLLGLMGRSFKCIQDTNNIEKDRNVSMEIPSDTVIAYSVLELEIKRDGHYDICLEPGNVGGFEEVDSCLSPGSPDPFMGPAQRQQNFNLGTFNFPSGSQQQEALSPLAELPDSTRLALFQRLHETMRDSAALSYLQCLLEDLCSGDRDGDAELLDAPTKPASGTAECDEPLEFGLSANSPQLSAVHLLVSAMEELPHETLSLLSQSTADFIGAFDTLMRRWEGSRGSLSIRSLPGLLQDEAALQQVAQLLATVKVTLGRDGDSLWLEQGDGTDSLPVLLCLSARGLSLLGTRRD